ncbi:hypothetical protein HDF11_005204 [Tunturiibacter psychrotolerans]
MEEAADAVQTVPNPAILPHLSTVCSCCLTIDFGRDNFSQNWSFVDAMVQSDMAYANYDSDRCETVSNVSDAVLQYGVLVLGVRDADVRGDAVAVFADAVAESCSVHADLWSGSVRLPDDYKWMAGIHCAEFPDDILVLLRSNSS